MRACLSPSNAFLLLQVIDDDDYDANDKDNEGPLVINRSDAWMVNPLNKFRMWWDLGVIMPLLLYLTVLLPFRLAFENEPPRFTWIYWWEFMTDMIFIADIFLNFRTGRSGKDARLFCLGDPSLTHA